MCFLSEEKSNHYKGKILIIDDSIEIINSYSLYFESKGFKTYGYTDPCEALKTIKKLNEISLVVLDFFIPNLTAPEFLRKLRKFSNVVVLLQTGYRGEHPSEEMLDRYDIQLFYNKMDRMEILLSQVMAGIKMNNLLKENQRIISNLEEIVVKKTKHLETTIASLQDMLKKDNPTDTYNKSYLFQILKKEINRCRNNSSLDCSIIIFDIDYFKKFNDRNGHLSGDYVLLEMTHCVKNSLSDKDMLFRFGGEEFVILLKDLNMKDTFILAERIRKEIEEFPFVYKENQPNKKVTISMGLASYKQDICGKKYNENETYLKILEIADERLYKAKNNGRNCVCYI